MSCYLGFGNDGKDDSFLENVKVFVPLLGDD